MIKMGFPWWLSKEENAASAGDPGSIPGSGRSPGGGHATHSSILAWRIPWLEEPGRLQSMKLQRIGHNWAINTYTFYHCYWEYDILRECHWHKQLLLCPLSIGYSKRRQQRMEFKMSLVISFNDVREVQENYSLKNGSINKERSTHDLQ